MRGLSLLCKRPALTGPSTAFANDPFFASRALLIAAQLGASATAALAAQDTVAERIGLTTENNDSNGVVFYIGIALGAFIVGAALTYALRRHDDAEEPHHDEHDERVRRVVAAIEPAITQRSLGLGLGLGLTPRALPQSPFTISNDQKTFGLQIGVASQACPRVSCTIGVIYTRFAARHALPATLDDDGARAAAETLVAKMRRVVRQTDHVELLNGDEIVVSICLLRNAEDLKSFAQRLIGLAQREGGDEAGLALDCAGFAVYPLNGYEGEELIAAARADYARCARKACAAAETDRGARRKAGLNHRSTKAAPSCS
jgi:hypothetical protein